MSVVIETTIGDFTVDLFLKERPRACQNFLKLCKLKYYNFSLFHTVQKDFIGQTGDPEGTGKGGTSLYGILYGDQARYFEAEKTPKLKHTNSGTLSFASHGDNMLGSQFFVTLSEDLASLDDHHCVFGQVVEGHDVLVRLNNAICDDKHQPYQDIRVTHTVVLDDPLDDPEGLEVPDRSPLPTDDVLKSGRIGADEELDDLAGRTAEELDELIAQREAAARATILEMVGDLPDVDSAPPENVLFVCKLNPVTTDDDLQIIFSRFGKIVSCEIIRDQRTKKSLQYGFIEFDNPKSCENAYFKMDNVLIDDRRIHVDFSQSVSHVKWRGKGRVTYQNGATADQFGQHGRPGGGAGRVRGGRPDADGAAAGPASRRPHGRDGDGRGREERRAHSAADGPAPRLDVAQLKALVGKRSKRLKSDSDGSAEPVKTDKKSHRHSRRSKRHSTGSESSSGGQHEVSNKRERSASNGDDRRSPDKHGRSDKHSRRDKDTHTKRHDSQERENRKKKKKHKDRKAETSKHKKRSGKKHKRAQRSSASTSGSDTPSEDGGSGNRKRAKKKHR